MSIYQALTVGKYWRAQICPSPCTQGTVWMQPFIGSEIPETQAPSLHLCLVPNSYLLTKCTVWTSFSKWSFLINKYIPKSKGYARHVTSQAELTNRISLTDKLLWGKFPPADGHPARLGNMKGLLSATRPQKWSQFCSSLSWHRSACTRGWQELVNAKNASPSSGS